MALLSSSSRTPTLTIGSSSLGIHAHTASVPGAARQIARAATNAQAMAPIESHPATRPARRRGRTSAIAAKLANGRPRTVSAVSVTSASEQVQVVGIHGPPHPENRDDDSQSHADFGHRDGD